MDPSVIALIIKVSDFDSRERIERRKNACENEWNIKAEKNFLKKRNRTTKKEPKIGKKKSLPKKEKFPDVE